ncbi:MAG: hypothetical protein K8T10_13145 [Candidatus Eremiobacteraeota bacterium]|nr:hypothetical protein [Candidatus Eremiobacteraeota bacterium]
MKKTCSFNSPIKGFLIFSFVLTIFLLSHQFRPTSAHAYNSSVITAEDEKSTGETGIEDFTFTVNEKIIKGNSLKEKDGIRIDGETLHKVMKSLGIKSSYSADAKTLTLSESSINTDNLKLPKAQKNAFIIVINGKIFKTKFKKSGEKNFILIDTVEKIVKSTGAKINTDRASNISAVTKEEKTAKSPDSHKKEKKEDILDVPIKPDIAGKEAVEAIGLYMGSLKKLFDKNKPSQGEIGNFRKLLVNLVAGEEIDAGDLAGFIGKFTRIKEGLKKLNPPGAETREIQRLAKSLIAKRIKIIEIGIKLLKIPKGESNPNMGSDLIMLMKQVKDEENQFNDKVRKIRDKYKLGPK